MKRLQASADAGAAGTGEAAEAAGAARAARAARAAGAAKAATDAAAAYISSQLKNCNGAKNRFGEICKFCKKSRINLSWKLVRPSPIIFTS